MTKTLKDIKPIEILKIVQWGQKRSVIYCNNTKTNEIKFLLMNNDYIMFLDELGLIQF